MDLQIYIGQKTTMTERGSAAIKREILALITTWVGTIVLTYFILVVDASHDIVGRIVQPIGVAFVLFFFWRSYFKGRKSGNFDETNGWVVGAVIISLMVWIGTAFPDASTRTQRLLPPGNVEKGIPY